MRARAVSYILMDGRSGLVPFKPLRLFGPQVREPRPAHQHDRHRLVPLEEHGGLDTKSGVLASGLTHADWILPKIISMVLNILA